MDLGDIREAVRLWIQQASAAENSSTQCYKIPSILASVSQHQHSSRGGVPGTELGTFWSAVKCSTTELYHLVLITHSDRNRELFLFMSARREGNKSSLPPCAGWVCKDELDINTQIKKSDLQGDLASINHKLGWGWTRGGGTQSWTGDFFFFSAVTQSCKGKNSDELWIAAVSRPLNVSVQQTTFFSTG